MFVTEEAFVVSQIQELSGLVTTNGGSMPKPPVTKRALDEDTVEQLQAAERLRKNAGFINRLVAKTNLRRAKQGKPPIGSASGSESGDVSKAVDRNAVIKALAGHIAERLRLVGRR